MFSENAQKSQNRTKNRTKIVPKSYQNRTKIVPIVTKSSLLVRFWYDRYDVGKKNQQSQLVHNFRYKNPFSMIFAPFESPVSQLSNGTKMIKNG